MQSYRLFAFNTEISFLRWKRTQEDKWLTK